MKKIKILLVLISILTSAPIVLAKSSANDNKPNKNENTELLSWTDLGRITVSLYGEGKISYTGNLYMAKMGTVLVYQLRIDNGEHEYSYVVQPFKSEEFNAVVYINGSSPYYLNVPAWSWFILK